jgi:maleylacetoacetate isomerase
MKLYGYFRSSASYRVRIALNLKGVAVEHAPIHLLKDGGQQKLPSHRARNPQALVPVLELDDGTMLTQSMAIIEYLDTIKPTPRLVPENPVMAAKVRAAAQVIACEVSPIANLRILQYLKGPLAQPQDAIDQWMKHWMLTGGLDAVEALIPGGSFCFGDHPTLTDCVLIPQLFNAKRFQVDYGHLPKICQVEATCQKHQAFIDAHPSRQADAE